MFDNTEQDPTFAFAGVNAAIGSPLMQMLLAEAIEPGTAPGYQLCKTIYSYHPLGAIMAEAPITRAQAKPRDIAVTVPGEKRIVAQFQKKWDTLFKLGATEIIHNLLKTSRIYGVASLAVGERDKKAFTALDLAQLGERSELYFNVLDPLNTAGSLVLNQDPNSPDFLKQEAIVVQGVTYHQSRTLAVMHEQPLYIDWTNSAFGFNGRSVYQRSLYPMKSFVQTMITDDMVTKKAGLLIAKKESPASAITKIMLGMANWQRQKLKSGVVGQVMQIGVTEDVQTLNMQNLDGAFGMARTNVLKNIASGAGMPASILNNETLTEGFGEGSEDFKKEVQYLQHIQKEMAPAYSFMDRIVQRIAWTPEFYETLKGDYGGKLPPYETWFSDCVRAFEATWPNLMIEPDSEKSKTADVQMKSVVAVYEVLAPDLDPTNKANLIAWVAENANERQELFASTLDIDIETLKTHLEEAKEQAEEMGAAAIEGGDKEPKEPKPFAAAA